uniref:Uncharacterized protein n=1 Tax=Kalanchoe fedtschenkoi TaxID=63787 RepID=A0A7N0UI61_KALFE
MDNDNPTGTIVFTTIGRPYYGFDVFCTDFTTETRFTDGISINYNAQFVDHRRTIVFISERSGSPQIYLKRHGQPEPEHLSFIPASLFHDRPIIRNHQLYFISAHQQPQEPFRSWAALYSVSLLPAQSSVKRLTPVGTVDYSPSVSPSGELIAVASYGSRQWGGEFHQLHTEIVVFKESDPLNTRTVVCERGGWPTWSGESTVYFHRQADDGWWSIFSVDLSVPDAPPARVTPAGVHAFTPAAMNDGGKGIAVATRRKGSNFRHVEIYNLSTKTFHPVTETINPHFHHYNPFVLDSGFIGYHRCRGEGIIPHLEHVTSPPTQPLQLLRLNGSFPSFSPDGHMIALNHDFGPKSGIKILKSDASKRWTLTRHRVTFCNSWSPTEKNVIYTSIGPIFQSPQSTVQIARISFHLPDLNDEIDADVKILTKEDSGNNAFPACSPDGKWIVFRSGRSGYKNLYVMDAVDGEFKGEIRQLTDGPWIDTMPAWSPNGQMIAFSSNRHNPSSAECFSIYIVRPDGSELRRVHLARDNVDRERINHVCFSPDSQWLLFTCNLSGVTAEPVSLPNQFQPYGDLYMSRVDGSGLRRLTWNPYENGTPAWPPVTDGNLTVVEGAGDKLENGDFDEPLWITCDL